jgi:hypothetical protein
MNITYAERQELNKLSKKLLGASSRWQKMLEYRELVTKKVIEVVPGDKGAADTEKEVEVPCLTPAGAKQYSYKTMTFAEIKNRLLEIETQVEAQKKQQEEMRAQKELDKTIQDKASSGQLSCV